MTIYNLFIVHFFCFFDLQNIKDIVKQEVITFVHNFLSNRLPPVFDGYFKTFASNHNKNTRHGSNLIKTPNHNTNSATSSLKIQEAKVWNRLENNLKTIPKVKHFTNKFKYSHLPYANIPEL